MKYFHLAVRSRWPLKPMSSRDHYADLWRRLRARFPKVLACCLMPDHVHMVFECAEPESFKQGVAIELRAFTRRWHPGKKIWEKVSTPELLRNWLHLVRSIRYVHLNPCRDRLSNDPLGWEWSTHRDALGLVWPTWIDLQKVKRLWEHHESSDFAPGFHGYVSSDPSAHVAGTPMPSTKALVGIVPVRAIVHAVRVATRSPMRLSPMHRKVAVHLVARLTDAKSGQIAEAFGVTGDGIRKILARPLSADELEVTKIAMRILADPRLLGKVP